MKLAIYGKITQNTDLDCVRSLLSFLYDHQITYLIFHHYAEELLSEEVFREHEYLFETTFSRAEEVKNCLFMYSLGGDGTMLSAATIACPLGIPIVGVNMGRLGFLTGTQQQDMVRVTKELIQNRFRLEERHILKVISSNPAAFDKVDFALNEVTIHKSNSNEMITVHVYVNGEYLNTYWADGLIISSPTGSTAYNLACGGPIISPTLLGNVITPIAPHSLTVRPIVIPAEDVISIQVESRSGQAMVAMDHRTYPVDNNMELAVHRAPFNVKLVKVDPPAILQRSGHG